MKNLLLTLTIFFFAVKETEEQSESHFCNVSNCLHCSALDSCGLCSSGYVLVIG